MRQDISLKSAGNIMNEEGRLYMTKEVAEVLKEFPAWIDSVPVARAYKNAVIAGNGDKLFRVIKMIGNQKAYKKCLADFARFLFRMKLVEEEQISTTEAGCIHSNVGQVVNKPGHYWFFDEDHNPAPGVKMVIFNIANVNIENEAIKRLIEKLGLTAEYSSLSLFLEDYPGWEDIDEDEFVNNTILAHYASHQDDVLKTSDLDWIKDALIGNTLEAVKIHHEVIRNRDERFECIDSDKDQSEKSSPGEEYTVKIIAPVSSEETGEEDAKDEAKEKANEETKDKAKEEARKEVEEQAKEEVREEIKEETIESAKEKIAFNKKLNAKMYEIYEQTAEKLKAERDVRWKKFISDYKRAIEEENYTVRSCANFLEMTSRDVKSPVYRILYDADQATKQYERELKRIHKTTMCFACHKSYDADLTFARKREHIDKCPNCGNLIRMTIDWLV